MALGRDVLELQGKIGYSFQDTSYLDVALTHSSFNIQLVATLKMTNFPRRVTP